MKKALKLLDNHLEVTVCIILICAMTIVIFLQVVMRYCFNNSLSWSEELARYMFIWLIYLGISYGAKQMKHIKIDAALNLFPSAVRPGIVILGEVLFAAFALYIAYTGFQLTIMQIQLTKFSAALHIPMAFVYAAPPVGFALTFIRQVQSIRYQVSALKSKEEGR